MTEPVGNRSTGAQIEAMLRQIVDADPGVTARRAPRPHPTESADVALGREALTHGSAELVTHGLVRLQQLAVAGFLQGSLAIGTSLHAMNHAVDDGYERGAAALARNQHDRMRGALAVLEGRIGSPEVQAEIARSPAFADGTRRAENLARSMSREDLENLVGLVRQAGNDGQSAVCLGRDHGTAFNRRYQTDPAFAHGVDFARRQHTDDPAAFAQRRAHFQALEAQAHSSAAQTPIRM